MTVNKKMIDQLIAERTTPTQWTVTPYVIVPDTCQCDGSAWMNEDEYGNPIPTCDKCYLPIENYFEDQEADAADRSNELTHDC